MTHNTPSSRRILILGAAGQLGRQLQRTWAGSASILTAARDSVDLTDVEQLRAFVRRAAPDVILNAAAYTAVDRAESEPELAYAVNAAAPGVLAEEALARHALFVHYSTDYVFDGSKPQPWTEEDAPNPLNIYGASKLAGERAIESIGGSFLIFRTSWVYAAEGKNFLRTMLRLAGERDRLSIVNDQFGAPTTALELARATRAIVDGVTAGRFSQDWAGLYHMTCGGSTSWFGFADALFARAAAVLGQKVPELSPISSEEFPTPAKRPRNSALSNEKLHARFGVRLAPWSEALDEVFQTLSASAAASAPVQE